MQTTGSRLDADTDQSITLLIESTWNGERCPESEFCTMVVRRRESGLELSIDAPLHGDPAPPASAGEVDGLWEFEVVELFVFGPSGHEEAASLVAPALAYSEIEIGPHGHWLCLQMRGIRARHGTFAPTQIEVLRGPTRWSGRVHIDGRHLPPEPWSLNAFAVHGCPPGPRRHLAAFPPGGEFPDFHRPEAAMRWAELSKPEFRGPEPRC